MIKLFITILFMDALFVILKIILMIFQVDLVQVLMETLQN